jgi:tetratricopeptide (TPR) repeat protein
MNVRATKPTDWVRFSLITAAAIYAFFAGLRTVADFDLGWQLATGRYIVQHHVIPSTELFSYTAHGNPWIYPPFSGVIFYLLFLVGGYTALCWLSAFACTATVLLIVWNQSRSAAILSTIAVPAIAFRTLPRAELFSTVLFAAFLVSLWTHFEGRKSRLWLLPLLMIAWVNLHTGFVAGVALVAAYIAVELCEMIFPERRFAAFSRLRRATPWLAASIVGTFVNPWGWRIYEAILRQNAESQLHSEFIGEWSAVHFSSAVWLQALSFRDPAGADWWLLAAGAIAIVLTLARKQIGPAIVLGVGAYASLQHLRLQALFAIIVCVVGGAVFSRFEQSAAAVPNRAGAEPAYLAPQNRRIEWVVVGLLILLTIGRVADLVTNRYYLWSDQITLFGTGPSWWFPERATQFLRDQHLPGNVFGDYGLGGYLTWRIGPDYADYFDGRFIPFGSELFARHRTLMTIPLDSPEWQQESSERNIQTVIFSVARIGGLGNFPLQADCDSHNWRPVYLDDVAVIFVRNRPENADTIRRLGIRCETAAITPPAIASTGLSRRATEEEFQFLMNAASIDYVLSRDAEAINNLGNAEAIFSDDPNLHLLKAQLAQAHSQSAEAEREYKIALKLRPSDAGWFALAEIYAGQQRYQEALPCILKSAALSQDDYDRYRSLGKLYLLMKQPANALKAFDEAMRKSPFHAGAEALGTEFNARVAEGKASAYQQLGDINRAISAQSEAVQLTPETADRWRVLGELYQLAGHAEKASEAFGRATALHPQGLAAPTPATQ